VRDFGAVGDGRTDDTSAFISAVSGVKFAAVIDVPAGEERGGGVDQPSA
jgi:hypothetical protein